MKKQILSLMLVSILCSCSKPEENNPDTELVGSWKLTAVLADPGDGSGTFKPVESNKNIEFKNNGAVIANGSLCEPFSDEIVTSGTYNLKKKTISTNCQNPNIETIHFEIENQQLILNFVSNEGYSQKFVKVIN